MDASESVVGMAGYFVSALLQTAGFHTLSQMIEDGGTLFAGLGYFIFLCCGLGALTAYALFGDSRRALYLLIGPILFYWMLGTTFTYTYTAHQFGTRSVTGSKEQIETTLKGSLNQDVMTDQANIPLFVAKYDQLVSAIVQRIVALIVDTKNKSDLKFAAQERVLSRLLTSTTDSPGFKALLGQSLLGECATEMRLNMELGQPRLKLAAAGSAEALEAESKRTKLSQISSRRYPLTRHAAEYVATTGPAASDATCKEIWEHTRKAALGFAEKFLQPDDELRKEFDLTPDQWREVYSNVREKLLPANVSATDMNATFRMLAGIFLKNSIDQTVHGKLVTQMEGRGLMTSNLTDRIFGYYAGSTGAGNQSMIAYFAAMVPYLQGMLLFLLSVSFPFFCIFLIMPNKIESFLIWVGLWAWVKSWDIGYAVVSVLREILWDMIPRAGQLRDHRSFNMVDWNDPANAFNFTYQVDPTNSMATYYLLISVLTLAVPIITGQFCAGAVNFYHTMSSGFTTRAGQIQDTEMMAARNPETTRMFAEMNDKRQNAMTQGILHAFRNPGVAAGSSTRRDLIGDGSFAKHMYATGKTGLFDYFYSQESQDDVVYSQMLENRRDIKASGMQNNLIDPMLYHLNEQDSTGRGLGEFWSGKNRDNRNLSASEGLSSNEKQTTDPLTGSAEAGKPDTP